MPQVIMAGRPTLVTAGAYDINLVAVYSTSPSGGTIQISVFDGVKVVNDAVGEIFDFEGYSVDTFSSTPHSWTEAILGQTYTVHVEWGGQVRDITVVATSGVVPVDVQFGTVQAGVPLWLVALVGGGLLYYAIKKKWI